MLLQFAQSASILMHPMTDPQEFSEAVTSMSSWSNGQWELKRSEYSNGGFELTLSERKR